MQEHVNRGQNAQKMLTKIPWNPVICVDKVSDAVNLWVWLLHCHQPLPKPYLKCVQRVIDNELLLKPLLWHTDILL